MPGYGTYISADHCKIDFLMEKISIHDLIEKYLDGSATEAERQELLNWYRGEADKVSEWPVASAEEKTQLKERMLGNLHAHIRKTKPRKRFTFLKYAAVFVLLILSGLITRKLLYQPAAQQTTRLITTGYGERKKIELPDGTWVWLAPGSIFRYPEKFAGDKREVTFEGEAFFEVAKNESSPFLIHTGELSTRVLGTSFNIRGYADDTEVKVTLLTGAVLLARGRQQQKLEPLQQGVFNKADGAIHTFAFPDAAIMLQRREGNVEYRNTSVNAIGKDLEHMFGVKISADQSTGDCLFYGRLKAGEDVEAFLNKLCLVINANLIKKGEQYIITQGTCR